MGSATIFVVVVALAHAGVLAYPAEPEIKFTSTPSPDLNPDHVPPSVCVSMIPEHGPNTPSNKEPPFVVEVAQNSIRRGETVRVVVKGLNNNEFKGIYIQGRINDKPVGQWLKPSNNSQIHVSDCPPGRNNALSYVSRNTALPSLALDWVAPDDITGGLVFQTTIVKSYAIFWTNVRSSPLEVI